MLNPHFSGASLHTPAPLRPNQTPLQNAVVHRNIPEAERELLNQNISPHALHSSLDHACRDKSCPLPIKLALLKHPSTNPQHALDLAVSHDDFALARQILKQGGVPQPHNLCNGSSDMRRLMISVARKNTLYPPGSARDKDTDLDRALREDRTDDAQALLDRERAGSSLRDIWRDAVRQGRLDILRALLVLGHVDQDRGFRLKEDPDIKINDSAVLETMKAVPQHSPKRGLLDNFNFVVPGIECRHLVEHRQTQQAANPSLKSSYADFRDIDTVAARVDVPERRIRGFQSHAAEVHLIDNRKFGAFIAQQFAVMEQDGKASRQILMETTNHAMSLELGIKEKDGKKIYVAKHFDPNLTTTHVRGASSKLNTFEAQDLSTYLDGSDMEEFYYQEEKGISVMSVRPSEQEMLANADLPASAAAGRTLTSVLDEKEIDGTAILHMLAKGFAGNLRSLKREIASRPADELSALLGTKGFRGMSGLYMALQDGHADAIKAFGELLELAPIEQRATLLAAQRDDGTSGLFMALYFGHVNAIKAYGELLKLVPEEQRAPLLVAKDADGVPALHMALKDGEIESVKAFGELLSHVPPPQRAELLVAKNAAGIPALQMALQEGNEKSVEAFGELTNHVPPLQCVELLASAVKGLRIAMQKKHIAALEAFVVMGNAIAPILSKKERSLLLNVIRSSHSMSFMRVRKNYPYYDQLIKGNPEFYCRFKALKNTLKADAHPDPYASHPV